MITVEAARGLARDRVVRKLGEWAAAVSSGSAASATPLSFSLSLKPPTEALALTRLAEAEDWARSWRAVELPTKCEIDWESRNWRRIGRQNIPVRLHLDSPDSISTFAGGAAARDWRIVRDRVGLAVSQIGASEPLGTAIRRHVRTIPSYQNAEWNNVLAAVTWLAETSVTGLRPRQLPIRGVDTKWFSAHRAIITDLLKVCFPERDLGVIDSDALTRMRVLDPLLAAGAMGGLADFAAPITQLAQLNISPNIVFVFENKESLLSMPEWPGAVVIHGNGMAVNAVAKLPWVQRSPVVYWGDLDSAGFAILHRLRFHHSRVTSVLMDEDTLLTHKDLWVPDPKPVRGEFSQLLPHEQKTFARLRSEGDARLEQERVPWSVALSALKAGVQRALG